MDEAKEIDIMVTKPIPAGPLSWRDGAIPLLAICLAWIFWACFDPVLRAGVKAHTATGYRFAVR